VIKNLNEIIKRKKYNNFIVNGDEKMVYGISDKVSMDAKKMIANDEIKERLIVLKDQLNFLEGESDYKKVFNEQEVNNARCALDKIKSLLETLNFKKTNLQVMLDNSLTNINISEAVKIKTEMQKIDQQLKDANMKERECYSIILNDGVDYENQMLKIKDKYDNVDILKYEIIDGEFSDTVISDYKKDRASKLVVQFLDSLTDAKKEQILNENENLRGYLNVGENI
jgi:hypothetical protein